MSPQAPPTEEFILLQHAHVTQRDGDAGKSAWEVRANMSHDILAELPPNLSEADVFAILHFAREFELAAWNAGIAWRKDQQNERLAAEINHLRDVNRDLETHNTVLAETLDRLTQGA